MGDEKKGIEVLMKKHKKGEKYWENAKKNLTPALGRFQRQGQVQSQ